MRAVASRLGWKALCVVHKGLYIKHFCQPCALSRVQLEVSNFLFHLGSAYSFKPLYWPHTFTRSTHDSKRTADSWFILFKLERKTAETSFSNSGWA